MKWLPCHELLPHEHFGSIEMALTLLIMAFVQQKVEEHMSPARFRGIRIGLGSVFCSLLLLLGLFTLTGTASAHITRTLHTHTASTSALVDVSCAGNVVTTFTLVHREAPKIDCSTDLSTNSCTGGRVSTFTFAHRKGPKIVCSTVPSRTQ
jgi:hypothetical protein